MVRTIIGGLMVDMKTTLIQGLTNDCKNVNNDQTPKQSGNLMKNG